MGNPFEKLHTPEEGPEEDIEEAEIVSAESTKSIRKYEGQADISPVSESQEAQDWRGRIGEAQNFNELLSILEEMGGIKTSNGNVYDSENLSNTLKALDMFVKGKKKAGEPLLDSTFSAYPIIRIFEQIPNTHGLKDKVHELIRNLG